MANGHDSNGDGGGLAREAILGADDLERIEVDVPEWGGSVWVRTMEATQRDAFEAQQLKEPFKDVRARLVAATVCDASGALLFSDADIPSLSRKSAKALDRIFAVSTKLSGLTKEDIDELKKNSSPIRSYDLNTN
jgi:hypothetical protein